MRFLFAGNYLPDYNRIHIIKSGLKKLGHEIIDLPFEKKSRAIKEKLREAAARADVVFMPCFTHREVLFVKKVLPNRKIYFDPLISHYMTKVHDYKFAGRWSLGALRSFYRDKRTQAAAHHVFADTEAHRRYFHETFGTPLEKMSVLYIGNSFDDFYPPPAEKRRTESSDTFRVGFYGGFIPLQGVMNILGAARLLREEPIEIVLIGNGHEYEKAKKFVAEENLTKVTMPGWIPYGQLRAQLWSFDLALGIFGDGIKTDLVIPNKIYHYAACGLPILTKQTAAIREIFQHNESVFLTGGSPQEIAHDILKLKEDAPLRKRLGEGAFHKLNSLYNEVKVAETLLKVIAET